MNVQYKLDDRRIQKYVELPAPRDAVIRLEKNITAKRYRIARNGQKTKKKNRR